MQLGAVIDTAIGLAFTFFLLSLIASGVQEVVAGVFKWRGTYLAKSIDVIMSNAPAASFAWRGVLDWARAHFTTGPAAPLPIVTLPPATPAAASPTAPAAAPPAAPLDAMAGTPPATAGSAPEAASAASTAVLQRVTTGMASHPLLRGTPAALPSYVSARSFSMALLEVLRDDTSTQPLFSQLEATVAALPPGPLRTTLVTFVQDAAGDVDAFRATVEHWFDDAMDRASGVYKRNIQAFLIALGAILAVALNVDALHLAGTLWSGDAVRAALVADAGTAVAAGAPAADPHLGATYQLLQQQQLPIGWRFGSAAKAGTAPASAASAPSVAPAARSVLGMLPGWIVTALAVSLGAPFWFDLLQGLVSVNMRQAGPKPARANGTDGA